MNNNEVNIYQSDSVALGQIVLGILFLLLSVVAGLTFGAGGFFYCLIPSLSLIISGSYMMATIKKSVITISKEGITSKKWGFLNWSAVDKISIATERYSSGETSVEELYIVCTNGRSYNMRLNGLATNGQAIKSHIQKYSGIRFY